MRINQIMEQLCKQAHRAKGHTAWVCSDDFEALCALDFLKRTKVAVPEKLSVVGFNNSLPALTANLTSYDHNSEAIMAAMLNYIVRPHSLGAFQRSKIIDFEGFVVSRGSAGRAPAG